MELFVGKWKWQRDDFVRRHPTAQVCYTSTQAILTLQQTRVWHRLHLHADLGEALTPGGYDNSGLAVARWIVAAQVRIHEIRVYAFLPSQSRPILQLLTEAGYTVSRARFYGDKQGLTI